MQKLNKKQKIALVGAVSVASFAGSPVMAQETTGGTIQDVQDTVASIGGIAGSAVTIVLVAMGVRLAIKQVNRVMTKG